jgi:hypothetical protein
LTHYSEENYEITCRTEANAKAENGCRGKGEGGKTFQPVAADVRRLKLNRLKTLKKMPMESSSSPSEKLHARPSIFDVVLGEYAFGEGITIFHSPTSLTSNYQLVELHETTHLHLCSCTTFGRFQKFLGELLKSPAIPNTLKLSYRRALDASVQHSWFIHEGVATASEFIVASMNMGRRADSFLESLPNDYQNA